MKNRLIPVVPTVTVYVVSVKNGNDRKPLAAFRSKVEALDSAKLIGMSNPELQPRYDAAWMPKQDFKRSASPTASKPTPAYRPTRGMMTDVNRISI